MAVKIRKDSAGLYVKHGDHVARPLAPPGDPIRLNDGQNFICRVKTSPIIRASNNSQFSEGEKAEKLHYRGSVYVRLKNRERSELWFIQDWRLWQK